MLMSDPANPTKPWFHSRDYGLVVANPFGERAAGGARRWPLQRGKPLRLRFGVVVHETALTSASREFDAQREFESFVDLIRPR
jgi:hypothetical protein